MTRPDVTSHERTRSPVRRLSMRRHPLAIHTGVSADTQGSSAGGANFSGSRASLIARSSRPIRSFWACRACCAAMSSCLRRASSPFLVVMSGTFFSSSHIGLRTGGDAAGRGHVVENRHTSGAGRAYSRPAPASATCPKMPLCPTVIVVGHTALVKRGTWTSGRGLVTARASPAGQRL